MKCPKCNQTSGNDWSQCDGDCPMPESPHFKPKFGTSPSHLHRLEAPDTSVAAAHSVDTTRLEREVYEIICSFGKLGCISDDVRFHDRMAGKPYSSVTARYKALMDRKLIEDTGERRKGLSGRGMRVMRQKGLA